MPPPTVVAFDANDTLTEGDGFALAVTGEPASFADVAGAGLASVAVADGLLGLP